MKTNSPKLSPDYLESIFEDIPVQESEFDYACKKLEKAQLLLERSLISKEEFEFIKNKSAD